jgi:hypothetical protein
MTMTSRVAPLDGDDSVAGAERLMGSADVVECRRDVFVVVGVLVRQHQAGCQGDCSGLLAVDLVHLGRPFPAFGVEVEAVSADPLRGAAAQCLREWRDVLKRVDVVGFVSGRPVNLRHGSCTQASRSDVSLIGPAQIRGR